jgi:prepilin-type N-terminal cleavage/methylation domain-containing protein
MLGRAGIEARAARLTISDEAAVVRAVELPRMPPRHLARAVPYLAERLLPFQADRARLGWAVLERRPDRTSILLACAWRDVVERLAGAACQAGLDPQVIEPRSVALGRALAWHRGLLFDVERGFVQLTVLAPTHPVFNDQARCSTGDELRTMRLLVTRAPDPVGPEAVFVAGALEDAMLRGEGAVRDARSAALRLNGHGPARPPDMPSGLLLAPLGLAMRSAAAGYAEINFLSPEGWRARLREAVGAGALPLLLNAGDMPRAVLAHVPSRGHRQVRPTNPTLSAAGKESKVMSWQSLREHKDRAVRAVDQLRLRLQEGHKRRQKGFTLIELLVVVSILGILAAIVTMSLIGITDRANTNAAQTELHMVQTAYDAMLADKLVPTGHECDGAGIATATNNMAGWPLTPASPAPTVAEPVPLSPNYVRTASTKYNYYCQGSGTIVAANGPAAPH